MKTCHCGDPVFVRGLCCAHYHKAYRMGLLAPATEPRLTAAEISQIEAWRFADVPWKKIGKRLGRDPRRLCHAYLKMCERRRAA